jgi:hypothetical protein
MIRDEINDYLEVLSQPDEPEVSLQGDTDAPSLDPFPSFISKPGKWAGVLMKKAVTLAESEGAK